ncbi:MAG: hypothetical protein HYZ65_15445 [Burkholderiales bacterium]|nr:hypothetical protein [Burkholderiales bacterium]
MARATKASAAVHRLRERSNNAPYSMVSMADGRLYLILANDSETPEIINAPLELDEFVAFVNSLHKQPAKKASKLDLAFEKKLRDSTRD